jgi:DNA-binding GntR family transcriptional regulator
LARKKVLSQDAHDYILDLILSKKLLPGTRIRESQIAKELHISRTPVRAAIQELSNKGLVDIHTKRFAQVMDYTPVMIQEIGILRLTLERLATKLALIYGNQIDFLKLQSLANQSFEAFKAKDEEARRITDCEFHLELSRISNNSLLYKFQQELYHRVQFVLIYHNNEVHDDITHIKQHLEFTDALMARDEKKALNIMEHHIIDYYGLESHYPEGFVETF